MMVKGNVAILSKIGKELTMNTTIDGRKVRFELLGDEQLPPMVFTGGGFWPLDKTRPGCEALAACGWRVINWDRPGSGGSDFDFDAPDLLKCWADTLAGLLAHLGITKAVIGGGSGGHVTSLAFAHHYLDRVSALVCMTPHTDDPEIVAGVTEQTFIDPVRVVKESGMAGLGNLSTGFFNFAEQMADFPEKRRMLIDTDPDVFVTAMENWSQIFVDPLKGFMANLDDAQLVRIDVPTLVLPPISPNAVHPVHTAEKAAQLLPNATLQDWNVFFGDKLSKVKDELDQIGGIQTAVVMAPAIDAFLRGAGVASA